ncbi:hypothetical protein O6H91_19G000600 [Diphasiastrum complanatum]|uniref:Uncharacterized protein n=1 Tax=Diphasiastrum complanatum TaxID=34168 RepID=A0ACC2ATG2_DIPCM|nr:hypothetical protein O6H91_19G000600 [Diphasiastrum complanatum]
MTQPYGKRIILVFVIFVGASALMGAIQLWSNKISLFQGITQGRLDQSSEGGKITVLQGTDLTRFDRKIVAFLPRKITSEHMLNSPMDHFGPNGFLWGVAKRMAVHQAGAPRHEIKQVWVPRIHFSETANSQRPSTGSVLHLSTTVKTEKPHSAINSDMRKKVEGDHQTTVTGSSDPMLHVDYAGPETHPPHNH